MRRMIGVKARVALCAFVLVYVASGWVGVERTIVPSFVVGVGHGLVGCSWWNPDSDLKLCPHSPAVGIRTWADRFNLYIRPEFYFSEGANGCWFFPLYFVPLAWLPWPLWKAVSRRRRHKRAAIAVSAAHITFPAKTLRSPANKSRTSAPASSTSRRRFVLLGRDAAR